MEAKIKETFSSHAEIQDQKKGACHDISAPLRVQHLWSTLTNFFFKCAYYCSLWGNKSWWHRDTNLASVNLITWRGDANTFFFAFSVYFVAQRSPPCGDPIHYNKVILTSWNPTVTAVFGSNKTGAALKHGVLQWTVCEGEKNDFRHLSNMFLWSKLKILSISVDILFGQEAQTAYKSWINCTMREVKDWVIIITLIWPGQKTSLAETGSGAISNWTGRKDPATKSPALSCFGTSQEANRK